MKYAFISLLLGISHVCFCQNIIVDSQSLSAQQLVENILIDSDCIENVVVTNAQGGDFGGIHQSYGSFDATGTNFPFQNGVVLSTGRLSNVPGPNDSLSDDDALGWIGDTDLESALNESNTFNATIIEFDFTPITTQISFRYLFASEEYQEGNSNTCQYSDLFGFLIRPSASTDPYQNIALVPYTTTPVKVTTVHSGIPGPNGCPPINDYYFGSWNDINTPINFNGQTQILTATTAVTPNESYHVKLVIADEFNARYDSAVFLEAGSFRSSRDLGQDRLLATDNPLCDGETLILDAYVDGGSYIWSKDGIPENTLYCENCTTYEVTEPGTYSVEILLNGNCLSFGEIVIEYASTLSINNAIQIACDNDYDGLTVFNLLEAVDSITNNTPNLVVVNFYLTDQDAQNNSNPIPSITNFENSIPNQIVFARVENEFGCYNIAELTLQTSNNTISIPIVEACDFEEPDGLTTFDLDVVTSALQNQIPVGSSIQFFVSEEDAFTESNPLNTNYNNTNPYSQIIFVKITESEGCYAVEPVELHVLQTPEISEDETIYYCTNTFPEKIIISGGVLNDVPNNYYYEWSLNGQLLPENTINLEINETGIYQVTITHPNGCKNNRSIMVLPTEAANTITIDFLDNTINHTIMVNLSGNGNYEFALDNENGPYQDANIFTNVLPGNHTIFVRDKNGCGTKSKIFSVLGFPKFLTPNGDGQNDYWQLYGINFEMYPKLIINIFDRTGKLISTQDSRSRGWDGRYNGLPMPNSDYWFIAKFGDGYTYTGHFALKR